MGKGKDGALDCCMACGAAGKLFVLQVTSLVLRNFDTVIIIVFNHVYTEKSIEDHMTSFI